MLCSKKAVTGAFLKPISPHCVDLTFIVITFLATSGGGELFFHSGRQIEKSGQWAAKKYILN